LSKLDPAPTGNQPWPDPEHGISPNIPPMMNTSNLAHKFEPVNFNPPDTIE
jgi:hypothetical protein